MRTLKTALYYHKKCSYEHLSTHAAWHTYSISQTILVAQVFDVQVPWTTTTSKSRVHFQEDKEESCTRLSLKCYWRTLSTLL